MKKTNLVFILENDLFQEEMIHSVLDKDHNHVFEYFQHSEDCLRQLHRHPMAVFIDYDLRMIDASENDAIKILDKIRELEHHTEVVLFSAQESKELASDAMKHGAYDYILLNEYRYSRFKNVLNNIEKHFRRAFEITRERNFKRLFTGLLIGFVILMLVLWKTGMMQPRNGSLIEPW